jgi:hypothetical protein
VIEAFFRFHFQRFHGLRSLEMLRAVEHATPAIAPKER